MSVKIPPGAPRWAADLVIQTNRTLDFIQNPQGPMRLISYPDVNSLPRNLSAAARFIAYCEDVGGATPCTVAWDGADWRRTDTNATL